MSFFLLLRRGLADVLALIGAVALVGTVATFAYALRGNADAWLACMVLGALTGISWLIAFRFNRPPRSRASVTGHIVLFESPAPGISLSHTPPLTIRGPRDAIERYIPLKEFDRCFGGWMLWASPRYPTADLPGEALGVWGRRTCQRFRRILRERGAILEVRREPGPAQHIVQLVVVSSD